MSIDLKALRTEGERLQEKLVSYRRTLHQYPELKMDCPWTEEKIASYLEAMGAEEIRRGIGGHGVCCVIRGAQSGKCLGIRADCDGLPIQEETGLPFASKNGNMHACGHDAHTAMALGAAELLIRHKQELKGCVKVFFQPYEEGDGGASRMIADGVLDNPHVDAVIGLHNGCNINAPYVSGDILVTPNPTSANIFAYKAIFHGTGAHVCWSHESVNPVYMACEATLKIRDLLPAGSRAINAITIIQGGMRNNIIPDICSIDGSIRSFDRAEHLIMRDGARKVAKEIAKKYGGSVDFITNIDLMNTVIDRDMFESFCIVADRLYPEQGCRRLDPVPMIGEDFARYTAVVPGLYFMLCGKKKGAQYPHHSSKFDLDEAILSKGSSLLASFALTWQNYRI